MDDLGDPQDLVGHEVVIEYHFTVSQVIKLSYCTVLKGKDDHGRVFSIALDKDRDFSVRKVS